MVVLVVEMLGLMGKILVMKMVERVESVVTISAI